MYTQPTRAFWRADTRNPYHAVLQDALWSGSDAELPTDPMEFVAVVVEAIWTSETRAAVGSCAAVADRPSLRLIRCVCRRCEARVEPVAAVFGWLRAANNRRILFNVEESPAIPGILPYGDLETIASLAAFRALGGRPLGGLLTGDPLRNEERRVVHT